MKEVLLRIRLSDFRKDDSEDNKKEVIKELIHIIEEHYQVVDCVSVVKEPQVHLEIIRNKEILSKLNIEEPALSIRSERIEYIEPASKLSLDRIDRMIQDIFASEERELVMTGYRMLK